VFREECERHIGAGKKAPIQKMHVIESEQTSLPVLRRVSIKRVASEFYFKNWRKYEIRTERNHSYLKKVKLG
jgi:hypothetical protein